MTGRKRAFIQNITGASKEEAIDYRLPFTEDISVIIKWKNDNDIVLFSFVKRGKCIDMHLATKDSRHMLKEAISDFVEFVKLVCPWAEKITGATKFPKLVEIGKSLNFEHLCDLEDRDDGKKVYFLERKL